MARMLIGLSFVELVVSYMKTQCLPYFTGSHQLPKNCTGFSTYYECTMSEEQWSHVSLLMFSRNIFLGNKMTD